MAINEVALNEVMKDTADAIREKTGKSEKIKPIDFATEIKGITSGGGDAPSGGGGNLSPDAVVYEPNGWCWKWVEGFPSDFASAATMLLGLSIEFGVKYYGGIIKQPKTAIPPIKTLSILSLGVNLGRMQNSADNEGVCIIAVEESKYCSIKVDATTTITANSMYEIINQLQPMTEVEFDSFMRANIGIMRITKEEYEALITE